VVCSVNRPDVCRATFQRVAIYLQEIHGKGVGMVSGPFICALCNHVSAWGSYDVTVSCMDVNSRSFDLYRDFTGSRVVTDRYQLLSRGRDASQ
jgi:hypothetical protein